MSDDEQLGRQKRTKKKTEAIQAFDIGVAKSQSLRESNARNKKIRTEMAAIDAAKGKAPQPEVSKKSKGKAKLRRVADSDDEMQVDSPPVEDPILLAVQKEEAAMKRLVTLIHVRDVIPVDKLEFFTHKQLEAMWLAGEGARPKEDDTTQAGAGKASGAKAAKPKPKPKPKAVAKTPAPKRIAAVVEPCSVTMLGSPIDALASAKKQSAFAVEESPIIQRKRGASTSNGAPGMKRSRIDALDKIKPLKGARDTGGRSVSGPASTTRKDDLITMSRSTSRAPTASRGPSQAPVASAPVPTAGHALDDPDIEMLGDEDEEDEEDLQPKKPVKVKKKRAPRGEAKGRATRKNYTGKELELVDETFILLRSRLGWDNAIPQSHEFNRMVRICWNEAADAIGTTAEEFPCDADHIQLMRDRTGSYRGHVKTRVQGSAGIVYGLDDMEGTGLTERVQYLLNKRFYVGPREEKRSGFYKHPFVARAVRAMYFVGNRPPALVDPEKYNPVPFNAIAAALSVTHFSIDQYSTGEFVEEKLTFETFSEHYETHMGNLQTWAECTPVKDVALVCKNLYEAALSNSGKKKSARSKNNPQRLTAADFQFNDDEEPALVVHKPKPKPQPSSIQSSSEQATLSNKATSSSERAKSSSKSTSSAKQSTPSAKPKSKLVGVVLKSPAKAPSPLKSPKSAPRSSGQPKDLTSKSSSESGSESEGSEGSESESESGPVPKAGEKSPARKVDQASSTPKTSPTSKAAAATTGGASALDESAEPNQSSELSAEEEEVEALKSGGNNRKEDEEMEIDEEAGVGELDKGAGDKAQGGETVQPPTNRNAKQSSRSSVGAADASTKGSPAPKSSSALADATGPIAKEKEAVVEEEPTAKEKKGRKGRKKKADKGKGKDPAESGSSGVKTRSALKSAS